MLKIAHHLLLAVLVPAVMLSSCEFMKYRDVTRDPAYTGQPKRILIHVIDRKPIIGSRYPSIAGLLEEQLVERLEERGIAALAAYHFLPDPHDFREAGKELRRLVEQKRFDALFIAGPTNRKSLEALQPGEISYPAGLYEGRIEDYDRFSAFIMSSMNSGGVYAGKKVLMEMALYDVRTNKRIWAALTRTYIWDTPDDAVRTMAAGIVEKLSTENIIP